MLDGVHGMSIFSSRIPHFVDATYRGSLLRVVVLDTLHLDVLFLVLLRFLRLDLVVAHVAKLRLDRLDLV